MLLNIAAAVFITVGIVRVTGRLVRKVTLPDVLYFLFWLTLIASFFIETRLYLIVPLVFLVTSQVLKKPDFTSSEGEDSPAKKRPKSLQLSEPPKQQPIGRPSSQLAVNTESESTPPSEEESESDSPEDFIREIPQIADECVRMTGELLNEELDYSPESLEIVDRLITETWNGEYLLPVDGLAVQFGSYTGEVIRRHLGGTWAYHEGNYVLKDLQSVKIAYVFPKAYRRLKNGEEDSLAFFYRALKASIEKDSDEEAESSA